MENTTVGFMLIGILIAVLFIGLILLKKDEKVKNAKKEKEKEEYRQSSIKKYKQEEMVSQDAFAKEITHYVSALTSSEVNRMILTKEEQPEAVVLSIVEYESMKELADEYIEYMECARIITECNPDGKTRGVAFDIDAYYAKRMATNKVQESIDAQEAERWSDGANIASQNEEYLKFVKEE
ncbi:MAG: hypothetical protein NTZ60_00760 [Campylobacterales bacterium]|nr:hypothetical protein [Campylobacterales bacterium]